MSWRGLFTGALALVALQAVLSSDVAAGRVGDMLDQVADLVRRALDPSVPAIPDLSAGGVGPVGAETEAEPAAAAATSTGRPAGGDRPRRLPDVQSV